MATATAREIYLQFDDEQAAEGPPVYSGTHPEKTDKRIRALTVELELAGKRIDRLERKRKQEELILAHLKEELVALKATIEEWSAGK